MALDSAQVRGARLEASQVSWSLTRTALSSHVLVAPQSLGIRLEMISHAILEAMTPFAEKFIAEANAQGEDSPRMAFLFVTERRFSPIPEFSGFCGMEEFKNSPLG